jgi:hypothetical protein
MVTISNPKSEISDWTVQFPVSDLGFEMQDSSNFKISSRPYRLIRCPVIMAATTTAPANNSKTSHIAG